METIKLPIRNREILKEITEERFYAKYVRNVVDKVFVTCVRNSEGKYNIVGLDGKYVLREWCDNIALISMKPHPCNQNIYAGICVRYGLKFGILLKEEDVGSKKPSFAKVCADRYFNGGELGCTDDFHRLVNLSELKFGRIPVYDDCYQMFYGVCVDWLADDTIILDRYTRLVPCFNLSLCGVGYYLSVYGDIEKNGCKSWERVQYFYMADQTEGYRSYMPQTDIDKLISEFKAHKKMNDRKWMQKFKHGLGYRI